jgi:hypothetical protein
VTTPSKFFPYRGKGFKNIYTPTTHLSTENSNGYPRSNTTNMHYRGSCRSISAKWMCYLLNISDRSQHFISINIKHWTMHNVLPVFINYNIIWLSETIWYQYIMSNVTSINLFFLVLVSGQYLLNMTSCNCQIRTAFAIAAQECQHQSHNNKIATIVQYTTQ